MTKREYRYHTRKRQHRAIYRLISSYARTVAETLILARECKKVRIAATELIQSFDSLDQLDAE